MNDEEIKAIEKIKRQITIGKCEKNIGIPVYISDLETVLNLIEKQKAEIETLKRDFEIVDHECSRLEQEDIRKDKIINEMAKTIYDYANLEVLIKCPAEYEGKYNMDLCKMNVIDRNCLICIKEYFENKVKEKQC